MTSNTARNWGWKVVCQILSQRCEFPRGALSYVYLPLRLQNFGLLAERARVANKIGKIGVVKVNYGKGDESYKVGLMIEERSGSERLWVQILSLTKISKKFTNYGCKL